MKEPELKENFQKLIHHLSDKWKGSPCPMCQHSGWTVDDNVYELRKFNGGKLVLGGGPILPIIPVTCNNCGNTVFVNALKAGVVQQEKNKEEGNKENENG